MTDKRLLSASGLLLAIAVAHLAIPEVDLTLHIILRLLYLVPIAIHKGKVGGTIAGLFATLLFLPHFFFPQATPEFQAGNIVAVLFFNLAGFSLGMYRDSSEKRYVNSMQRRDVHVAKSSGGGVLFYVDDSPLSLEVAQWLLMTLGNQIPKVTLFRIQNTNLADVSETREDAEQKAQQIRTKGASLIEEIQATLTTGGYPAALISAKTVESEGKKRISDIILREIGETPYDFVLLGKHGQTKAQEFLFGDTAVRLVRTSPVPVLAVIGTDDTPA